MGFLDFGPYRLVGKEEGYDVKLNECTVCGLNRADGNHTEGEVDYHAFVAKVVHHDGRMGKLPVEGATFDELRLNWGIASIQRRLNARGYDEKPFGIMGVYGYNTEWAVKQFQSDESGLKPDGVAGTITIRRLFDKFTDKKSFFYGLPENVLCGLVMQESGWDVCATGAFNTASSGTDRGLIQFNDRFNPGVTDELAFDAAFSIDEGARRLRARFDDFLKRGINNSVAENDEFVRAVNEDIIKLAWDCAIAAHNSPADAESWWETGSPPDEQIASYVFKIRTHCA